MALFSNKSFLGNTVSVSWFIFVWTKTGSHKRVKNNLKFFTENIFHVWDVVYVRKNRTFNRYALTLKHEEWFRLKPISNIPYYQKSFVGLQIINFSYYGKILVNAHFWFKEYSIAIILPYQKTLIWEINLISPDK